MDDKEIEKTTLIAIPAYNCAKQITRVLGALVDSGFSSMNIWVVDNLSSDTTVSSALQAKRFLPKLRVFVNMENINLGGTHKIVFENAKQEGFSHVVILHGDDQATPEDISGMFRASAKTGGSSVLGSRFMKNSTLQGYDWKRILGNQILNQIYSIFAARRLSDLGSGLNLFCLSDLDSSQYLGFGNTITFNYQLILDLVGRGVAFSFYPIVWKEEDQVSNARNVSVFLSALRILIRWRFSSGDVLREPLEMPKAWNEVLY
jgi:glycosyltransferase involved in cell wall biosynthesis